MENEQASEKLFQILSLSGGGYRGLYTATVLAKLEESVGHPIARHFDLIAGTSIGGILALAVALEVPMSQVVEAFESHGESIFPKRTWWKRITGPVSLALAPKYRADGLKRTIVSILGETTTMGDLKHPTIVPAINVTKGGPQFFKTPHHRDFQTDWKLPLWKIALATSAAPTIFPLAEIDNSHFADGGLFANSPEFAAVHEAQTFLAAEPESIRVFSIGTTEGSVAFPVSVGRDLGYIGWGSGLRLLNITFAAQEQCAAFMLQHTLSNRFYRVNERPSADQQSDIGLDVATENARRTLKALGAISAQRVISDSKAAPFFQYSASTANFYYGSHASAKES